MIKELHFIRVIPLKKEATKNMVLSDVLAGLV
jgi:hypothetical protein